MTRPPPEPNVDDLDATLGSIEFPVRQETVVQAWQMTADQELSERFQARMLEALGTDARRPVELMILVTLVAKRGRERDLEKAAGEFAAATNRLEGVISSTLYRTATNPRVLLLVERLVDREVLSRHMASDYFRRFQDAQRPLLERPATAIFYTPARM
jgi:quinol monooxygenase YgiN